MQPEPCNEPDLLRVLAGKTSFSDTILTIRYSDNDFEYRHVQLPKQMLKVIPKEYFDGARGTLKLLWEEEWRALGITQVIGPLASSPYRN
jgi:hypothetical protein